MTELTAHHGLFKDTNLHVDDTGGTGRPVVLIHGWPVSCESWKGQVPAFADAGYRIITYDRRGFGRTNKPCTSHTYDNLTEDFHTLLAELNLNNVTLVGFWGLSEFLCNRFGVTCRSGSCGVEMITYGQGNSEACPGRPENG